MAKKKTWMENAGAEVAAAQQAVGTVGDQSAGGVAGDGAPLVSISRRSIQSPDAPGVPIVEPVLTLTDRMEIVEAKLEALVAAVENLGSPKPFEVEEADGFVPQHDAPEEYIKVVHEICGNGFGVKTEPHQAGTSFKLTITPPPSLREIADSEVVNSDGKKVTLINDRRVRIISLTEGVNGVRDYATKVRDFCIRWAFKNGVTYGKKS